MSKDVWIWTPFQESNRHQDDDSSLGVRIRKKKKLPFAVLLGGRASTYKWWFMCLQGTGMSSRHGDVFKVQRCKGIVLIYPPWNQQFARENRPSQKETSLPTIHFQGLCWFQGEWCRHFRTSRVQMSREECYQSSIQCFQIVVQGSCFKQTTSTSKQQTLLIYNKKNATISTNVFTKMGGCFFFNHWV